MVETISKNFQWVLLFILLFNLSQRKLERSYKKRMASLYWAILALVFQIGLVLIIHFKLAEWFLFIDALIIASLAIIFRKKTFPFKLKCQKCGAKLSYERVIGYDDCLCKDCYYEKYPDEKPKEVLVIPEDVIQDNYSNANTVDEIDWDNWEANEICVITHVEVGDKLLFIEKKRGMGEGYYNAAGGHVEETETAVEAAIREVKEETGLNIINPEYRGKLHFQFKHKAIRELAYVYFANNAEGELKECEETRPFWQDKNNIPYDNMWQDDLLWLPRAIEGEKFEAYFIFDDRQMLDSKIIWENE